MGDEDRWALLRTGQYQALLESLKAESSPVGLAAWINRLTWHADRRLVDKGTVLCIEEFVRIALDGDTAPSVMTECALFFGVIGRQSEAGLVAGRALALDPAANVAAAIRLRVLRRLRLYELAIAEYERSRDRKLTGASLQREQCELLVTLRQYQDATELLAASTADWRLIWDEVRGRLGEDVQEEILRALLRRQVDLPSLHGDLATTFLSADAPGAALEVLDAMDADERAGEAAQASRVQALAELARLDDARTALAQAREALPDSRVLAEQSANLLQQFGQLEESARSYGALANSQALTVWHQWRKTDAAGADASDRAAALLRAILAQLPLASVKAWVAERRYWFDYDDDDRPPLDELLDAAVAMNPDDHDLLVAKSQLLRSLGSVSQALDILTHISDGTGNDEALCRERALTLVQLDRVAEAAALVELGRTVMPLSASLALLHAHLRAPNDEPGALQIVDQFVAEVVGKLQRSEVLAMLAGLGDDLPPDAAPHVARLARGLADVLHKRVPPSAVPSVTAAACLLRNQQPSEAGAVLMDSLATQPDQLAAWLDYLEAPASPVEDAVIERIIQQPELLAVAPNLCTAIVLSLVSARKWDQLKDVARIAPPEPLLWGWLAADNWPENGDPPLESNESSSFLRTVVAQMHPWALEALLASSSNPTLVELSASLHPSSAPLIRLHAGAAMNASDYDAALERYEEAIALDADDDPSRAGRLTALRELGRSRLILNELPSDIDSSLAHSLAVQVEWGLICLASQQPQRAAQLLVKTGHQHEIIAALDRGGPSSAELETLGASAQRLRPNDGRLAMALGDLYTRHGTTHVRKFHLAEPLFDIAMRYGDNRVWAVTRKSYCMRSTGRLEQVHSFILEEVGRSARPDSQLLTELAVIVDARGDLQGALEAIDRSLRVAPNDPWTLTFKASLMRRTGQLEAAKSILEELATRPREMGWYQREELGYVYFELNETDKALAEFKSGIEWARAEGRVDEFEFNWNLGNHLAECERFAEAAAAWTAAMRAAPNDPYGYHNLADQLAREGRYRESREMWSAALSRYLAVSELAREARFADHFLYQGMVMAEIFGDHVQANRAFRAGLEIDPNNYELHVRRVELYREWSNVSDASPAKNHDSSAASDVIHHWDAWESFKAAERLLRGRTQDASALLRLGELYIAMEQYEEAESVLWSALRLSTGKLTQAAIYKDLGAAQVKRGSFREALASFEQARIRSPYDLSIRTNVGEALLGDERFEDAREAFEATLRIAPGNVEAHIGLSKANAALAEKMADPDLYQDVIDHCTRALALEGSNHGSKRLKPSERAKLLYSRGLAHVRLYELSGPIAGSRPLTRAVNDFKSCRLADPTHSKASRALTKIREHSRGGAEWWGERAGPIVIAAAALVIFLAATTSIIWGVPIKRLEPAFYGVLAFGSLLFMVAGFYLPRLMKLKVGGLELEKSPVDVVATSATLGIS